MAKKERKEIGGGIGEWVVTYGDMVTLLLCFFVALFDTTTEESTAAQELITEGSTGVTYWEGAVDGKGTSAGRPVTCEGYVEMTGYAGSLGALF
ncbi:MAG: flagellar motor protein MotB [Syntrophaceae bacterium PtaU1.Bin231]|nr:MAG: flagellar motor protein MotB [Syntrophaceae bacterium PtaU1.Bin231]